MKPLLLAVDGLNLIRRIFEARQVLSASDMPAAIEATAASLDRALQKHRPTHAVVVFEMSDKTWRHLLYPDYKAHRSATPILMREALPDYRAAFRERGVSSIEAESYEADDVIATLANAVAGSGGRVVILSTDKIYLQLVDSKIELFDHFNERAWKPGDVEEKYGVPVSSYIDYLALVGDSSNNIKGVPGVGPKTAEALIAQYGSLDAMLGADVETASASLKKVHRAAEEARRCHQLVTLKTDVALGHNLRELRLS